MSKKEIKSTAEENDVRGRLSLPEIHLNQIPKNVIEELSCKDISDLNEFLRQNGNLEDKKEDKKEDKMNLLRRITYCLMQLHDDESAYNQGSHSQIFIMKKDFVKNATSDRKKNEKKADRHSLADLYCLILTDGMISEHSAKLTTKDLRWCSIPDVALDVITEIASSKKLTMKEVMQHPFHWSDQQKVLFICRAFDFLSAKIKKQIEEDEKKEEKQAAKHKKDSKTKKEKQADKEAEKRAKQERENATKEKILSQYNMGDTAEITKIIGKGGWINKLILDKKEIEDIRKKSGRSIVGRRSILKYASKWLEEESFFELLHFFRDRYANLREDSLDVKMCFGSYPAGYLKFFTDRFPKLFMHVYSNMKTYLCQENGEFANQKFNQSLFNVNMYTKPAKPEIK